MRRGKWIIFGMLVVLLAGCSGKKTEETFADAKNAESTDEKNTLDFVDAHGECYTVEINEAVAKNPYDKALFVKNENKISYEDTQNAKIFCKEIEEAGYDAMIYSNMLWEAYELDLEKLLDYPVWYADYEELPQTPYRFSMWQYSSTGSVPGIEGNVDLNIQLPKK